MAQHWNKLRGGKFQLEYASKLVEKGYKINFEVNNVSNDLRRIYDITIDKAVKGRLITTNLELKNWSKIFKSTIKDQFIKDLQKMDKLGDIKWVFNTTSGINKNNLKDKIIKTLKKADGETPIDELSKLFTKNSDFSRKASKWIGKDRVSSKSFLEWLDKPENFNKLFEIAE